MTINPFYIHGVEQTPLRKLLFMGALAGGKEVEDTATGNPLTFITDLAKPLKSCLATWQPHQSGSGDPSPSNVRPVVGMDGVNVWHTGKNLFDKDGGNILNATAVSAILNNSVAKTVFIQCKPLTKYTVSKLSGHRFCVGYTKVLPENGVTIYDYTRNDTATEITVTTGADAQYLVAYVYHNSDDVTPEKMIDSVQIEVGETATAYSPYHGTSYTVAFPATGKNLLNFTEWNILQQNGVSSYTINNSNSISITYSTENGAQMLFRLCDITSGMVGKTYAKSGTNITNNDLFVVCDSDGGNRSVKWNSTYTIQAEDVGRVLAFRLWRNSNVTVDFSDVQCEQGSSATAYEPYTATVYGGSLDLTTGVLTAEWWSFAPKWKDKWYGQQLTNAERRVFEIPIGIAVHTSEYYNTNKSEVMCNCATWKWSFSEDSIHFYIGVDQGKNVAIVFQPIGTDEDTEIHICGTLATPQTFQLSPTQITALLGNNTMWADADELSVTFLKKG